MMYIPISEDCPVLNMSDNRELYIHLDTMTPLRLEENSLSRSQMGIQDHDRALETPPSIMDYDYHEYFETLYTNAPVKTSTTTRSSLPPSVFFAKFSAKTTRTIATVKSSTPSPTKTSTVSRYPLFYKDNIKDSDMDIFEPTDEIGNSSEILRNLSLTFPDPRPANASGSRLLQCNGSEVVCTAVNVLIILMIVMIVLIVLCLYFDPRKCAESLKNSDRVIL